MTKQRKPSYLDFDQESYPWKSDIDYRESPEAYRIGKGEQGVLICEPYKTEIGSHWRFKTPEIAIKSSDKIFDLFLQYLGENDSVGADMARKFLQMGYTRARRYANYKGGRKYDKENDYNQLDRGTGETQKAESAAIFHKKWKAAEANNKYITMKSEWKKQRG